ncbi:alpha/beta hydrolase [Siculibacillus lacustris]|uniref:Alpha/beta hydrolase n=1 Tax=Siculibacillus lacustris TaxID=1549641 RepID=A0A4Q9VW74_9HYPH|nr:alpha/beta fold hydrolase [Siculibacillus lacustris]TBW39490.1 alpha/beta hydrolase [Siculibacillus lacustris]
MTVLVLPGLHGSGPGHWQHAWLEDIEDSVLVEQRDWSRPDRGAWVETACRAVRAHPGALLVGHSLGAILIAHLAADHPELPIGGALLVAPADVEAAHDHHVVAGFAPLPSRPFAFPSILVASRDDPWMPFDRARVLANIWESALVDLGRAGHVNAESGLGRWAEGRRLLARIDGVRRPSPALRQRPSLHLVAAAG